MKVSGAMKYNKYKKLVNIVLLIVIVLYLVALFIFPDSREFEKLVSWIAVGVSIINLYIHLKYKGK